MATDKNIRRETATPAAGDSEHAKTTGMGQHEMALVLSLTHNGSSIHEDEDDDYFKPTNEERAIVVAQQDMDVDDYVPPPPLRIIVPESLENGQEKCPGFHYEEGTKEATTKKTSTCFRAYKRRRRRSVASKSKTEQKPALFDSSRSSSSSYSKGDKDEDFEPPTPTRKRGRPESLENGQEKCPGFHYEEGTKEATTKKTSTCLAYTRRRRRPVGSESKIEQKPVLFDSSRSSNTAWDRAEELMKKLPEEGPSFVRLMLHSHVVKGFWLGLPDVFCITNLPRNDVDIVLEDEEGHTCTTKYLACRTALSGGWKGFAKQNDLKVDDALVFQLVQPTRFKVYILRENNFTTTDGALGLLSLDKSREINTSKNEEKESSQKDNKSRKVLRKEKKKVPEEVTRVINSKPSSHDSDNLASEEAASGGIQPPGPDNGDFVTVKSPMNFKIVVGDGDVVLPDRLHMRYYELCHARKAFLHRHVPQHLCTTLATDMIMQTANIAEGIMAASLSSLKNLAMWKKDLESLMSLGMDVGFMIERVDELIGLIRAPSSTMEETDWYKNLKLEQASVAKQLRYFESRLSILKDRVRKMDAEIKEAIVKKKEQAMRELASSPW